MFLSVSFESSFRYSESRAFPCPNLIPSLPPPPSSPWPYLSVASRELALFSHPGKKVFSRDPSAVLSPVFRLRCAIENCHPATCWLEGKSHLFRFSTRRSPRGETRCSGAPGAWLISCVTSIMHVLRHRRTLGVPPLSNREGIIGVAVRARAKSIRFRRN